ncbi:MAG: N-acetylmuramoyl-L-alanine amidase, partial [Butyricicoccus sp.]
DNGTGQTDVLRKIVAKCNAHSVDVDISLHLNSGGGHGTECLIYGTGGQAEVYANKIQNAIVKRTGYADRGVKVRKDLYVLKNTDAPAVLVECCFVDSSADAKMWNPKTMAAAICEGVTGKNPAESTDSSRTSKTAPTFTVGKKYKLLTNLKIRASAAKGDNAVKKSTLSAYTQSVCTSAADATLKKGVEITCKAVKTGPDGSVFAKTSSGWLLAWNAKSKRVNIS